jgi:hypothetical protein
VGKQYLFRLVKSQSFLTLSEKVIAEWGGYPPQNSGGTLHFLKKTFMPEKMACSKKSKKKTLPSNPKEAISHSQKC